MILLVPFAMKKKRIFGALVAVCVVVVSVCGIYHSHKSVSMSDLMLANVEALALTEITVPYIYGGCVVNPWYDCYVFEMGFLKYYCPDAFGG